MLPIMMMLNPASLVVPTSIANAASVKPILAERFKTKACQKFDETGACPYETRCMFAHGPHELHTKEQNIADNLVTEEAIKAFQKARAIAAKSAQKKRDRDQKRKAKRALRKQQAQQQQQQQTPLSADCCSDAEATSDDDESVEVILAATDVNTTTAAIHAEVPRPTTTIAMTAGATLPHPAAPLTLTDALSVASGSGDFTGSMMTTAYSPRKPHVTYDTTKFVSPLAAAMLSQRKVVSEECHCALCAAGEAHHDAEILLA